MVSMIVKILRLRGISLINEIKYKNSNLDYLGHLDYRKTTINSIGFNVIFIKGITIKVVPIEYLF